MRVAIVGPCASGKSTVVEQLRQWGYDAFVVGQEHSVVKDLWRRQSPDALIFLDAEYETIQERRGRAWPRWIYDLQRERLADARAHATLVVNTSHASIHATVAMIAGALDRMPPKGGTTWDAPGGDLSHDKSTEG